MVLLANGFALRGIIVTLVVAKAEGPCREMVAANISIVDLGTNRMVLALPRLMHHLRKAKPDVVLSALLTPNVLLLLSRVFLRMPMRVVISERSTISIALAHGGLIRKCLFPLLARWLYPKADAIVAVSGGVARDLSRYVGLSHASIHTIYNPVYSEELIQASYDTVAHPWFQDKEMPVVLSAGRLHEAKAFDVLIEAFALVRSRHPAKLIILGEGPQRSRLENIIRSLGLEDQVQLPGFVDNPWKYMRQANVFVLSSKWEGLPGALIEAMACGTPVVATDCPSGPSEILEEGKWGRLVPVGDVTALRDAIIKAFEEQIHPEVAVRAKQFSLDAALDIYGSILFPSITGAQRCGRMSA